MLGEEVVYQAAERGHEVVAPTHFHCNIAEGNDLLKLFHEHTPAFDGIINCAGVRPSAERSSIRDMIMTNALGPHMLAKAFGVHVVQVSTDCVYSGRQPKNGMWMSAQLPDPIDLYGRSKLTGEIYENALTVRTSFLGLRHGLLPWIIAHQQGTIEAWTRAYWNGGSARAVAQKLLDFSEQKRTGLLHLAAADPVTKAWMVEYALSSLDRPVNVRLVDKPRIWRALQPDVELQPVKMSLDELLEQHRGQG